MTSAELPILKDSAHLDFYRSEWEKFVSKNFDFRDAQNLSYYSSAIHNIQAFLHKNNLDFNDNNSFALIHPDLTAQIYHQKKNHLQALLLINKFNFALGSGVDYNTTNFTARRFYILKDLVYSAIPIFEAEMKQYGLPADVNILHQRQLAMILKTYEDKTLADELEKAAFTAMKDKFLHIIYYSDSYEEKGKLNRSAVNEALASLTQIREMYVECRNIYAPCTLKKLHDEKNGEVDFSLDNLDMIERGLTIALCKDDIQTVKKFQDQGHYILDASGSGHGMMALPFQDILEKLQKAQIDIYDPKTYEELGTTKADFRARYMNERRAAQNSTVQHENRLLKPKFRI